MSRVENPYRAKPWVLAGCTLVICLVFGFGTWSVFSSLSGAIIAPGTVEVAQNRQVVQHPDGGVVRNLSVTEGDTVAQGDILIRLDSTRLDNELALLGARLFELRARHARLAAERDGLEHLVFDRELRTGTETNGTAADVLAGQDRLFRARRESELAEVAQLDKRVAQIANQIDGIEAQSEAVSRQADLLGQEIATQKELYDRGLSQTSRLLSLQREGARLRGQLGKLRASIAELRGHQTELEIEKLKLVHRRRETAIAQLRDLRAEETQLRQKFTALTEQRDRLEISAPVSGTIYDLAVFAERSVVRAAEPLLYLVPQDQPLVISSQVAPIYVDDVYVGQSARLRFPAFNTRDAPELEATVVAVSPDAFSDTKTGKSYYKIRLVPTDPELTNLGGLRLIPGMPVEAFVNTGTRSPVDYFIAPLKGFFDRALREG